MAGSLNDRSYYASKFHTSAETLSPNRSSRPGANDAARRERSKSWSHHPSRAPRNRRDLFTPPSFMSPTVGAPVVHTSDSKGATPISIFFTLLMSIVGAGLFSIPGAMHRAGTVGGALLIIIVGVAMSYTAELLLRTRLTVRKACPSIEYLVLKTSGRRWSLLFNAVTLTGITGGVISYVALVKELLPQILRLSFLRGSFLDSISIEWLTVCLFAGIVFPICLLRNISSLRFSSYAGFVLSLYIVALSFEEAFSSHNAGFPGLSIAWPMSMSDFSIASGIINFSFVLQINVLPLFQELLDAEGGDIESARRTMGWIIRGVVAVVVLLYIAFGLSGLTMYGADVEGNILNNFSDAPRFQIARVTTVLVVVTAFPLLFYPLRSIFLQIARRTLRYAQYGTLRGEGTSFRSHVCVTVALISFVVFVALQVPGIQYVFSFTGGTAIVAMCYFFPVLVFCKQLELSVSMPPVLGWIVKKHRRSDIENVHAAVRAENSLDTGKPLLDLEGPNELLNDTPHASEDDDESSMFIDFVRYGHLEREAIALLLIASFALGLLSTVYTAKEV